MIEYEPLTTAFFEIEICFRIMQPKSAATNILHPASRLGTASGQQLDTDPRRKVVEHRVGVEKGSEAIVALTASEYYE